MKVDLHIHTHASKDSLTSYRQVLLWANRRQLGALAITDHNTIAAALALRELSPIPIIVGEEIRTTRGEIIGLFLQEEIPPDLSPAETVRRIRAQGGVVYVPHPCDRVRHSALEPEALREIIAQVDVIEVLNARVTLSADNSQAEDLARAHHLRMGAGSDAHQGYEIGRAYVEMPPFEDAASFVRSLSQGRVIGGLSSPLVHVGSTWAKLAKEFRAFTSFPK